MKKKKIIIGLLVVMLIFSIVGFGFAVQEFSSGKEVTSGEITVDDASFPKDHGVIYSADINSDGADEDIRVVETDAGTYEVNFENSAGKVIWSFEVSDCDQSSIHICNVKGTDYILLYCPYMYYKGHCNYFYKLYTIDEYNIEKVIYSDDINEFDIIGAARLPVNDMVDFYEGINYYLDNSTLIISTNEDTVIGPKPSAGFYDCFNWLWESGITDKKTKTLKENLKIYDDYMYNKVEKKNLYTGDFLGDGKKESISVIETYPHEYEIRLTDSEGTVIWSESFSESHVGWNSFLVCEVDGRECLMTYNPYVGQGHCHYNYEIFTIWSDGENYKKYTRHADSIEFDIDGREHIPVDRLMKFTDELDGYLKNATLLASTLDGELVTGPKKADGFWDHYWWLYDKDEYSSLMEAIEAYDKDAYDHRHSFED